MNKEQIIQQKIEFLNGTSLTDVSQEAQDIIAQDPELQKEIAFIEQAWHFDSFAKVEQPSDTVDNRFYQLLEKEKHAQEQMIDAKISVDDKDKEKYFLGVDWKSLFFPQPLVQLSLFSVLFFGGWVSGLSMYSQKADNSSSTAQLQKQVDSLSSLVALSMLQNNSAAERIAGVNYTKSSQLKSPEIERKLLNLLNNDRSSAVRLAIVDVLSEKIELSLIQEQLLLSLRLQNNPIVQIAMLELLLSGNNALSEQQITNLINDDSLDEDVKRYLQSFIEKSDVDNLVI